MTHYYIEYGGGLGDVFFQMHQGGSYHLLNHLSPDDRATVVLVTCNPHTRELFDYHPRANQFEIRDLGYTNAQDVPSLRERHGLPRELPELPTFTGRLQFYAPERDLRRLSELDGRPYIVFSVCAGLPERNIPSPLVVSLTRLAKERGFVPIFVGRDYPRLGRAEYRPGVNEGIDFVDTLTVPGVCRLVENAAGVVCCHSAINMLAWLMRKPQLLLYPESVYRRHIVKRDVWSFGVEFPECFHGLFDSQRAERLSHDFFQYVVSTQPSMCAKPKTVTAPPDIQMITINETIPRLTSPNEVKFLCWLARQKRGNIVEIGCNKGATTRELAQTNPDKTIYAVDYLSSDRVLAPAQYREQPSPEDFCVFAHDMANVVCIHRKPEELNYSELRDVSMVFIDGDHTFRGVKAESEPALEFLRKNGGGIIVWHDYYEDALQWVAVRRYVLSLNLEIEHVRDTWLAVARIHG